MKKLLITTILLLISTLAYATDYTLDANCQAAWLMETTGTESDVCNSYDLSESSGTIDLNNTDFKFGAGSRDFENADTEQMVFTGTFDIEGADQAISIVTWFKPEAFPEEGNLVSKWDAGYTDSSYRLYYDTNGRVRCQINNNGTNEEALSTTLMVVDTWYHIGCVSNDTDIRIYIDGSLDSNGSDNPRAYTAGIDQNTYDVCVGCRFSFGTDLKEIDGLVDEVAIFDDELSAAEVAEIYTDGLEGSGGSGEGAGTSFNGLTLNGVTVQ